MNIVMFSMTPLFADKSMGGAQKQLKKVALYLAEIGHDVTILCTRRADANEPFNWHERLQVVPIYRFKQPFPEPYATHVYNIAAAIQDTGDSLADADVFYSHDGGLIFPYVYQDIPAVVSLRSILFSETLQSGFLFQGDALIVPSEHTAEAWKATAGRFFPDLAERIHVIHNGLDWETYRPTQPSSIRQRFSYDPRYAHILYPHRPDDAKGIRQTIAVVDLLVHRYGLDHVRVLVPRWIDTGVSAEVSAYYQSLQADIDGRGLREHFIFHDWISDSEMPQFYSLGALTLALGPYVETFGNTPYESMACGTPVIAARVGPYRDMLPEEHVHLVDFNDNESTAAAAAHIIQTGERVSPSALDWLHANFAQSDMVEAYAELILNTAKLPQMPYVHQRFNPETRFVLAPWCHVTARGIYHDFEGRYETDARLCEQFEAATASVSMAEDDAFVLQWLNAGYIVPGGR